MTKRIFLLSLVFLLSAVLAESQSRVPTIEELLHLAYIGGVEISPDGEWIAYTVTRADFAEDEYRSQIWLVETGTRNRFQLTRGKGSSSNPKWSPDARRLAFLSNRNDDKNQVFVIYADGGEALQLTDSETKVVGFEWAPDGKRIVYVAEEPEPAYLENRRDHMGEFEVVRREYAHSQLWSVDVPVILGESAKGEQLTRGEDLNVVDFSWAPDGKKIAFSATVNPDLVNGGTADLYVLDLDERTTTKIVSQSGPDSDPHWSPDGTQIVFSTVMGRQRYYPLNNELAVVPSTGGTARVLTGDFDEEVDFVAWNHDGIYFQALQKTTSHLFHLDPSTKKVTRLTGPDALIAGSFSLTRDGKKVAFYVDAPTSLREVGLSSVAPFEPLVLTTMTEQIADYRLGTREVISWKS